MLLLVFCWKSVTIICHCLLYLVFWCLAAFVTSWVTHDAAAYRSKTSGVTRECLPTDTNVSLACENVDNKKSRGCVFTIRLRPIMCHGGTSLVSTGFVHTRADSGSHAGSEHDPMTHPKTDPWPIMHDPWLTHRYNYDEMHTTVLLYASSYNTHKNRLSTVHCINLFFYSLQCHWQIFYSFQKQPITQYAVM